MSSGDCLRTFVIERLTVAAEEIFRVFQQKIDAYEAELDYQRRLVESVWTPEIKLQRIELSQPPVCQEEEVPADQHQDRSYSLDQEDSEPPPIKEEQEEPCCHQDREQLTVKQETNTLMVTPIHEEDDQSEDEILDLNPGQSDEKPEMDTTVESCVSPEPDWDQQLLSNSPHGAESKDQENYNNEDSGSTTDEEPKQAVKQNKRKRHGGHANNPAHPAEDCDTHTRTTSPTFNTGDKRVKFKSDLTGHSRIQTSDDQPAPATTCGKGVRASCGVTFSSQSKSTEHIRVHTGEKPYICKTCGKSFNQTRDLTQHVRIHTGERPYLCKTCGKAFKQSSVLIVHMKRHTGINPYSCKTCGKSFNRNFLLTQHMRVHTGEKPYSCETCGKTFRQSSSLCVHRKSHTGEKPYSCKTCGKSFYQTSVLTQHMRVHTGEKPYLCKTCGKAFKQSSALTVHMRGHTGERPYSCKTCGKAFKQYRSVLHHMKLHKADDPNVCKTLKKRSTKSVSSVSQPASSGMAAASSSQ